MNPGWCCCSEMTTALEVAMTELSASVQQQTQASAAEVAGLKLDLGRVAVKLRDAAHRTKAEIAALAQQIARDRDSAADANVSTRTDLSSYVKVCTVCTPCFEGNGVCLNCVAA